MCAAAGVLAAHPEQDEYRLKAAFIHHFPQFVQWPAGATAGRKTFEICLLRPQPFGDVLHELVRGDAVGGRQMVVRTPGASDDLDACHVLAIVGRAGRDSAQVLRRVASKPILTVGEDSQFLQDGGIIALQVIDRRVRFDISATNARRAGLQLSSQLLQLAVTVREEQP